jgi:hypothetical protein
MRVTRSYSGHMSWQVPTRVIASDSERGTSGSAMCPSLIARARSSARSSFSCSRIVSILFEQMDTTIQSQGALLAQGRSYPACAAPLGCLLHRVARRLFQLSRPSPRRHGQRLLFRPWPSVRREARLCAHRLCGHSPRRPRGRQPRRCSQPPRRTGSAPHAAASERGSRRRCGFCRSPSVRLRAGRTWLAGPSSDGYAASPRLGALARAAHSRRGYVWVYVWAYVKRVLWAGSVELGDALVTSRSCLWMNCGRTCRDGSHSI